MKSLGSDENLYYSVMIEMRGKNVVVFGGGKIAYRKVVSLLQCEAKVTVISVDFTYEFDELLNQFPSITLIKDSYKKEYLKGNYLIVGATNAKDINISISEDAKELKILCNIVDSGEASDYIVPSVVRRGDLILSVSTSGKSPSLSKKIKNSLEEEYPKEFEEYVNLLGKIREMVIKNVKDQEEKKRILNSLTDLSVEELRKML
ncbi:precorrin-2 dehydrogenase/sirohydrochlorin ferrochelatase [Alkalibaculum bacchi]|uniref:precorrin-2 dehydrogenase n=1 Tax=Alkalibaculum bacchi TaxID=645887 RepID=A0A366ICC2_9FIRM|nr:bifunctional precorrin-2 dehydrogenase/sirohydrochlorin ferrochelatase [Alkalibaculum bacchi]RBP68425.1 precorrin-2 dehydrogenase/sirohydrochlorin ferrochelatase [Alkalibaculum bacchi]